MDVVWNYLVELRKELIESQKIRAQVIGFKITFVSAAIGLIGTNLEKIPNALLVVPAFAAIFFDFLINGYSFSIKRLGFYIKKQAEPALRKTHSLPEKFLLWEEFLEGEKVKQKFALIGNIGITFLAIGAAIAGLLHPFQRILSTSLIFLLIVFFTVDLTIFVKPFRLAGEKIEKE